ncbi:PrsW family intramembrane metalloprotease [Arthrobacter sp. CDRTa11]|uniref:PrsW family intramembrane metalloprotease n=1 Tax=Arthrobacter sp. CDRTa11 TaxID=2651199 RepID=UPI002265CB86|nr:PrsW family intramembrane metalloprotease [Arthrobacter sp. CDRTa11]UZX03542.1 PrsW family intramembrane metalloprotease [Arthrobacter sp. CDRTa11]
MSMHPFPPADGQPSRPPGPQGPLPGQANPTWMGHVDPQYYRPAPGNAAGPVNAGQGHPLVPPQMRSAAGSTIGTPSPGLLALTIGGGVLAFLSLFLVVPFLLANTGTGGFLVGFVASLVPLSAVLLAVYVIDRWEPEPKRLLLFAFTWGAAVSIAVTLLVQPFFALAFQFADEADFRTYMATIQAPVVEEFAKSLGLLLLLLMARKHFDGPVDGVVFAFTIAGGFAFTENILYFGRAIAESASPASDLAQIFLLRGVMSPFAHAIFTGTTGLIMGFAARRWHSGASVAAFFIGLLPAMFLHNRWNSMGQGFLVEYILVQVPIFVLAIIGIILLRVAENRLTRQRLLEYAAAGWFTPSEVAMLATPGGRRSALNWAGSYNRRPQMKAFVKAATQLAFTRQRILSGRDVQLHQAEERQQLHNILALRAAVAG